MTNRPMPQHPEVARPLRIAMWSGPRNISTALMRAWENRPDCAVVDEPLYAAYLAAIGLDHPAHRFHAELVGVQPRAPAPGDQRVGQFMLAFPFDALHQDCKALLIPGGPWPIGRIDQL